MAESLLQIGSFEQTDPMFARESTSDGQRSFEYFSYHFLDFCSLFWLAFVEQDVRVQIAISSMTKDHDGEIIFFADLSQSLDNLRDSAARYGDIFTKFVGGFAGKGGRN